MVKEIRLYLCRDEKSGEMLEAFRRELNLLPRESRPKLKAKVLKLRNPSGFEQYVRELEELFGGLYVEEFKKYGIRAVPAVVVDGEKLFEGKYLTRDEIRSLLGLQPAQPQPAQPPPASRPPQPAAQPPAKPFELTPVELVPPEEEQLPELKPEPRPTPPILQPARATPERATPGEARKVAPQPPTRVEPRREELPEEPFVIEPIKVEPVKAPQPGKPAQQQAAPPPLAPEPRRAAAPQQPPAPRPAAEAPQAPAAKFSCYTCIHFNPERSRCRLLHIPVPDPNSPPCGRGRR